jgi:hypothetical protein
MTGILGHNFWKTHRLNDFVGGFPRDYILLMRTKIKLVEITTRTGIYARCI